MGERQGDLIRAPQPVSIGTLVDRGGRHVKLIHLPGGRSAQDLRDALALAVLDLPPELRRPLTWDQDSEMAYHHQIVHPGPGVRIECAALKARTARSTEAVTAAAVDTSLQPSYQVILS